MESLRRDQLELVIQKRKLDEVYAWFKNHFVSITREEYASKCPFVIIQGPTGCGKTSVLRWISSELKIPIKEFSETTDLSNVDTFGQQKASRFEFFVLNSLVYNPLYLDDVLDHDLPQDDDEFDSDDDWLGVKEPPPMSGVIIHIESPPTFLTNQSILVQTIMRLMKSIKELARTNLRRIAIVFEILECDMIPNKLKTSIGMQTLKFNPIIKANMKKLIEDWVKRSHLFVIDKETIEAIAVDSDGDIRACINSLQLLCNKPTNNNDENRRGSHPQSPVNKKQKLAHDRATKFELNPSLMRDTSKSLPLFHVLGKIFYQKRYYPLDSRPKHHKLERPYPTENSTEYLVDMLDIEGKKLLTWLHQHYHKFCCDSKIDKAATFMDNLSTIDTVSIESLQSSQFYELRNQLDSMQKYLAVESTVFSLYEDQSTSTPKSKLKKVQTADGSRVLKTSVDNATNNGDLYSFNKPVSLGLTKLAEDYKLLLDHCTIQILSTKSSARLDPTKLLVDYLPYLNQMPNQLQISRILEILNLSTEDSKLDVDTRHENLLEMIEQL